MFVQLTKEYLGHPPGKRLDVSQADAEGLSSRAATGRPSPPPWTSCAAAFNNPPSKI